MKAEPLPDKLFESINMYKKMCVLIVMFFLVGCGTRTSLAPVVELKWQPQRPEQRIHRVRSRETLYAVAFRYDIDHRQLAAINHLHPPYTLHVGQILRVRGGKAFIPQTRYVERPRVYSRYQASKKQPSYRDFRKPNYEQNSGGKWLWPVNGRLAANFIPQQGKKGIDIAGVKGEKIRATSSGVVAYAGSGLSGYGNLIIIKHNNQLLTAYGNNSRNLVTEGQNVKAGQDIAEIGVIDRRFWGVHFEIRKNGKPVNPLDFLQKK
ncbi:MAG: peptidoglycan DD-metalloendopeptidase family protein [Tatlockia sp.]|nr:peptidoglycan DD-metalloendopeptidase family protein [Tatlockia sp.]